jgi:hypothetical protein
MCRIGHIRKKKKCCSNPATIESKWWLHGKCVIWQFDILIYPPSIQFQSISTRYSGWRLVIEWWLSGSSAVAPHPAGPGGGRRRQRASERPVFGTARRTTGATFRGGIVVGTSCTFG